MQVSALKRLKQVLVEEIVRVGLVQSYDTARKLTTVELIAGGTLTVKGEGQPGRRVLIKGDRIEQQLDVVEYVEIQV